MCTSMRARWILYTRPVVAGVAERMDRAYWITWYDLPEEGRDAYFSWLQGTYAERVLERPGVLWAAHYASEDNVIPLGGGKGRVAHAKNTSLPSGDRFILIFGAAEPHAFATPTPARFHSGFAGHDREMLAMRIGERMNVMIEEARVRGPEAGRLQPEMAPGPCIQLGSFNAGSYDEEDEMLAWYAQWRLPSLTRLPGCIRVRKLVSVSGWAKHACFYEFTSLEARNDHFVFYESVHPEMESWSKKVVRNTQHAPGSANVARRIWLALRNGSRS